MVLPETTVELLTTAWPFTETCPLTVMSPLMSFGAAMATIDVAHQNAATVRNVTDF
jgi:hypothetical protein